MPRIVPQDEYSPVQRSAAPSGAMEATADFAVSPAPAIIEQASVSLMGLTVVYDYPAPVTIRDGVDALRLRLDEKTMTADIVAEAAPRYDTTAFLVARGTNTLEEPILPGQASLYADGTMVGQTDLPLFAAGDDIEFGFGPIDGLTVERRIPDRQEGDRGIINRSNTDEEKATLIAHNLTAEDFTLRLVDNIPVSQQDDLQIDWTADPAPSETDPDGRRGVLVWTMPISAGEEKRVELSISMRWPEDSVLFP